MKDFNKIKAETFDIMQYFYRTAHEPIIHCYFNFNEHIDETALKKAVDLSIGKIPIIACTFETADSRPFWRKRNFTSEDIIETIDCSEDIIETIDCSEDIIETIDCSEYSAKIVDCPEEEQMAKKLLTSIIDIEKEPQLKIFLIREQSSDKLCILINHMVCDGAGFKEYLYLLSELYTKCKQNKYIAAGKRAGDRSFRQLLKGFSVMDKLAVMKSRMDSSKLENQLTYPFEGNRSLPFICSYNISKDNFMKIKQRAKGIEATLNDMFLAGYARAISIYFKTVTITIPCPVDLRKYMKKDREHGICNLTGNLYCSIKMDRNEPFETTVQKVSEVMKAQKSSMACLKGTVILDFLYRVLPYGMFRRVFFRIFKIPVLSYTNLGILNKEMLSFDGAGIKEVFITGAVKYAPYFQLAVSTFDDSCTLSCNLHGTQEDRERIHVFLKHIENELIG